MAVEIPGRLPVTDGAHRLGGEAPLGGEGSRLTVAEAIRAHTLTPAYMIGTDDRVGSIEEGKLADLIILEKNLFDIDLYEIGGTAVQLTMMNGRITHRDGI